MKVQNWWVKPGLLMSGIDPTKELSIAVKQFPSEYTPKVYMTGDAHRTPPFEWATVNVWGHFFLAWVGVNKICCHVEKFSDEVEATSVPNFFAPVFHNHKVFGFEPNVFKTIKEIILVNMEIRSELSRGASQSKSKIHSVIRQMSHVHDMGYIQDGGQEAMRLWDQIRKMTIDPVPPKVLWPFSDFLSKYNNAAMELRTGVNREIGANIQRIISQFPDHVHMITCGDAHIKHNPLYEYIQPSLGCFGIADDHNQQPPQQPPQQLPLGRPRADARSSILPLQRHFDALQFLPPPPAT
jgi:hypothetical protein